MRLGAPQSRSGSFEEEKNLLPLMGFEFRTLQLVVCVVIAIHILEFRRKNKGGRRALPLTRGLFKTEMAIFPVREISFITANRLNNLRTVKQRTYQ
jgi:hypothetical protein